MSEVGKQRGYGYPVEKEDNKRKGKKGIISLHDMKGSSEGREGGSWRQKKEKERNRKESPVQWLKS